MSCPDYYRLAETDGREFFQFYHDECTPLVRYRLNASEQHALQSACEHLFRRGLKDDETQDVVKFRFWLSRCLTAFQDDASSKTPKEHAESVSRLVMPVLALVELRRLQKLGQWAELGPKTKYETTQTVWGTVEIES